jgi:UDP-N-acetylglucosamine 2-epimerase
MKIATIVGARPQFIKATPMSRAFARYNQQCAEKNSAMEEVIIHTGQHYDHNMSSVFFETLDLPSAKYNLGVGSGSRAWQLSEMVGRLEPVLVAEHPDTAIVYGDTNSTLAGALTAASLQIPLAHIEAGLRSFNRKMPEESNRVLTDHLSDLLFAPTETAVMNLSREGINQGVHLVGDLMHETMMAHLNAAKKKSLILSELQLAPHSYALATVHRAANTDAPECLRDIFLSLVEIGMTETVIWPVHPRTKRQILRLKDTSASLEKLRFIEPLPYLDMLMLEKNASVILTDSGGVQKEARWLEVPCVTLRDETEWPETIASGWNRLAGARKENIVNAFRAAKASRGTVDSNVGMLTNTSGLILRELCAFWEGRVHSTILRCTFSC